MGAEYTCHACGHPWVSEKKQPAVKEFCERCSAYLHCCLNCRFHDPSRHNECHIPNTDWVGDRAGANFCDEFEFRAVGGAPGGDRAADARSGFDALFGDDGEESAAPKSLDDLFGG
jgi:hypothetical protein